jgi:simple sugar transport system ATP-binding protein
MARDALRLAVDVSASSDRFVTLPTSSDAILSLEGITRRFGSVLALDDASLQVRPGTVHAMLGENGAGKTTLMRVAFGLLRPDAGTLRFGGNVHRLASPADALALGIGMVHQHFTLVPAMTVAENVALGGRGAYAPRAAAARVREVATRAGLALDPDAVVSSLPVGAQQRCEIVKALARDVRLLILDEPTAVLAPAESAELLQWMRRFADAGHAVVLITHKLRDALAVADDITVLRHGRTVLTTLADRTDEAALAAAMLGAQRSEERNTESSASSSSAASVAVSVAESVAVSVAANSERVRARGMQHANAAPSRVVLAAQAVSVRDVQGVVRVRDASMVVSAGEIVGIAAVEGSGQSELLRVLAGRMSATTGAVTRPDVVGFVPEDRHRDALLLEQSLVENIALRGAGARRGLMPWSALRAATERVVQRYDVRTTSASVSSRTLSGGNQQKLVLGRELDGAPEALVVENPSRGLDFLATAAVREALRGARDAGAAVLLYSSDLDEVLELADRVYAMHQGTLIETVRDREQVGRAMLGSLERAS